MASDVDRRAAVAGSFAGGFAVFLLIFGGFGGLTGTNMLTVLVVAPVVSGIPAGIGVGWLDRTYRGGMNAGGLAALGGTLLGVFGFAAMRAVTIPGLTPAQRFDVIFIAASYSLLPLMAVFPFIFFVGGLTAVRVGSGREPAGDFELPDLPTSEE